MNKPNNDSHQLQMQAISDIFNQEGEHILTAWLQAQVAASSSHLNLISQDEIQQMSVDTLNSLKKAIKAGNMDDISSAAFDELKDNLKKMSERYALLGFSPSETAQVVFSLKEALQNTLQEHYHQDSNILIGAILLSNKLLDSLGLFTFECFSNVQKIMLSEQITAMNAMATPVMQIWNNILMIPIVGTIDSARSQDIMDAMLENLARTDSEIIILDIQGVASMDSAVANHLLKITKAVTMMGCYCIVSGVTSHVAQAMANLGLDLGGVNSAPTLRKGLRHALNELKNIQEIN